MQLLLQLAIWIQSCGAFFCNILTFRFFFFTQYEWRSRVRSTSGCHEYWVTKKNLKVIILSRMHSMNNESILLTVARIVYVVFSDFGNIRVCLATLILKVFRYQLVQKLSPLLDQLCGWLAACQPCCLLACHYQNKFQFCDWLQTEQTVSIVIVI